ncbi:Putative receptor-like protein kinase [Glycine soja]|uniref:Putative receptor-like protein kinase n=1 Tax=Glycine soja TaxID=3848 RepID=A0A0B2PQK1_GLYSO|nr:Putative receptor-like protein kinase [Glycine soja]
MVILSSFFRCAQSVIAFVAFIIIVLFQQTCFAKHHPSCPLSSCGKVQNITYPFRLKGHPDGCGLSRYELDCVNNATVLTLFSGKYHVQDIDYKRYQIRLTDAGIAEDTACSIPRYVLQRFNFSDDDPLFFTDVKEYQDEDYYPRNVVFLNCTKKVNDDPRYVEVNAVRRCDSGGGGHIYALLNGFGELSMMDIKVGCRLTATTFASWKRYRNVSYADIRKWLHQGFRLSWFSTVICRDQCGKGYRGCNINQTTGEIGCEEKRYCYMLGYKYYKTTKYCGFVLDIRYLQLKNWYDGVSIARNLLLIFMIARILFGITILLMVFIYMWRRRRYSMYENIEMFLLDNNLNPIRYEYKEIKKMTKNFKQKLGQGGFGSVYKGKLRSGPDVAIKMLSKSKANGEEFISEVATIGRIHHVNVVRLVGYCVEGEKHGLIYEYMPNGSLEKYIFPKEGRVPLSYEKTYEISLGIARGIAYLHEGCDVQILHFDIKPHNILLDESFIPKVSDFGLAKLHPVKDRSLVLPEAIGTLGYIAPELYYKNIGGVSYKADVYSFGKLLMEMASRRRNSDPLPDQLSSNDYFPFWIYDELKEEKDIDLEDASDKDKLLVKKMFMVALWCIQFKPNDRPSMKKIVEMLEGNVESLEMPPKPIIYPHDGEINSNQTSWSDSTCSSKNLCRNKSNH